jgi:hypothetical protein
MSERPITAVAKGGPQTMEARPKQDGPPIAARSWRRSDPYCEGLSSRLIARRPTETFFRTSQHTGFFTEHQHAHGVNWLKHGGVRSKF